VNIFKRSILSITRQPVKSILFLVIVFLLSTLAAGAILTQEAIQATDQALRRRMPTISTVMQDAGRAYEQTGEWPEFELLSPDLIRQIGEFPQVRAYDYSIDIGWGVTGYGLNPWYNPHFWTTSFNYDEELGPRLYIEGIGHPNFLEVREDFIELIDGHAFSEAELNSSMAPFPALISAGFAEANDLDIGSIFEIQVVVFDLVSIDGSDIENRDEPPLVEDSFPLEIIGIFEPIISTVPEDADLDVAFEMDQVQFRMQHRIYVPNFVAEQMFDIRVQTPLSPDHIFIQNFFLLEDPMYFDAFAAEVANVAGGWRATDFSSGFRAIHASMENMQEIANFILLGAIGATLITVALATLLFLRDRKQEFGIYLALGEKKGKIISQVVFELGLIAIVGMTIALFTGNIISEGVSRNMLRQNIAEEQRPAAPHELNQLEHLGYRFELTIDEMLESYEIGIDGRSVLLFYTIGLGTVSIAIIIPTSIIVNKKPKDTLMKGSIG